MALETIFLRIHVEDTVHKINLHRAAGSLVPRLLSIRCMLDKEKVSAYHLLFTLTTLFKHMQLQCLVPFVQASEFRPRVGDQLRFLLM